MVNAVFHRSWLVFCTCFLIIVSWSDAAEVRAELDREAVAAGSGAALTLKIFGSNVGQPQLPQIENFIFESRGQSRQIQIINGNASSSIIYNYAVGSNVEGDFEIAGIKVEVDGEVLEAPALKLKVLPAGSAQPQPGANQNQANQNTPPQSPVKESERYGFLTVELADNERKHAYVGEIAPVRIKAWLPADARVQLRGGIQPEGSGFTLHNLSNQPQQTYEARDGKQYLVVTWFGGISATKAGKYPASLSLGLKVAVRDPSAKPQRRNTGGPFDDPFFDDVFDRMNVPMIEKDVTLKSEDQEIEVRPLPQEGRPEGFTGAVGQFKFKNANIPNSWNTGEPQQVTASIEGSGNFSLMGAPEITPKSDWKIYSSRDEFRPGDETSFSGTKNFQFNAMPRKAGSQDATLSFSYFDPERNAYETITTNPKKVQIAGKDLTEEKPAPAGESEKVPEKPKNQDELAAQRERLSRRVSLVPLADRSFFWPLVASPSVLAIVGAVFAGFRRRRHDPQRRAQLAAEKATQQALAAAKQCVSARDAAGFFAAGRLAIQQRLGTLWGQPAQAITAAEVASRLSSDSPVARFFSEADRYEYSRSTLSEISPEWQSSLENAMISLASNAR